MLVAGRQSQRKRFLILFIGSVDLIDLVSLIALIDLTGCIDLHGLLDSISFIHLGELIIFIDSI